MIAAPSSAEADVASPMMPSRARRGSSVRQGQLVPRSKISARIVTDQIGRERQHDRGLMLPAMHLGHRKAAVDLGKIEGVNRAGIEPEIARELVQQVLQHAAIAAVAVEDQKIARRQRAHERTGKLAQMRDKACDRKRERAGGPVMLAREANRNSRQLPEVELLAETRHDLAREPFRHHDIGVERQMRAVLLDRAEWQA
jgi:hypothetical protein